MNLIQPALTNAPKEISTAGWIALGLIVLFVVILNYSLWAAVKRKNRSEYQVLHRLGKAIRNPHQKENEMLQELGERVKKYKGDGKRPAAAEDKLPD